MKKSTPFASATLGSLLVLCAACAPEGGTEGTGGSGPVGGTSSSGGTTSTGGTAIATGGNATGGTSPGPTGGTATGGKATGGTATGGTATGGTATGGKATGGNATGGNATGGSSSVIGPCDIYASASPATPCVAAYSTTRLLRGAHTGALYQVRKGGSALGSGGTVQDIGTIAGGFADGAAQDTFCGTSTCTVSLLYDQSGRGNNLKVAPAGCYSGTAGEPDYESNAKQKSVNISGHKVYALYMIAHDGYRNNSASGMPTGTAAQGIYEVADGTRIGGACCWDFGNASTNNCYGPTGSMNALYFGTGYWGKGAGSGPWFMGDFEAGVWSGGSGASNTTNNNLPSSTMPYAFGILKTSTSGTPQYAIRVGNAQSGSLTTAYDGQAPATWQGKGGIILGIGGDNSNSSLGTFFEGAITAGRPSDATDAAVLANVQAAKYGQ